MLVTSLQLQPSLFKTCSRQLRHFSIYTSIMDSSKQRNYLAKSGFDASGASGLYNKARPDYPAEAISTILSSPTSTSSEGLNVVELGPGTGICSRLLINPTPTEIQTPNLNRFLAFEPSGGMRVGFEQNVLKDEIISKIIKDRDLKVQCLDGTFESFNAGEEENDLVVIAQAWHWCPNFDRALSSISETLKPGGILALIWNLEDRDVAPWVGKLRDLYEVHEDNTPQYRLNYWHEMYSTPSITKFHPSEPLHFKRDLETSLQGVKDRVLSKSYISILNEEKKKEIEGKIEELFGGERGEGLNEEVEKSLGREWIKKDDGVWKYPYRTDLFMFQKK